MSEEALLKILEKGSEKKCVEFFSGMPEVQRRSLAPVCQKWFRKINRNYIVQVSPNSYKMNPLMAAAGIAVMATANYSELKKLSRARPRWEITFQILAERKPDWADKLARDMLSEQHYPVYWRLIRNLITAGLIQKPNHPNYYLGMISGGAGGGPFHQHTTIEKLLLAEPDLLEDEIWRLFEFDGDSQNSLANHDRISLRIGWRQTLISLEKKRRIPRERLLSSSLDALERDFNHFRAKWFATLYDALKPTDDELKRDAERFLSLLRVSAPNIVTWAFKKVIALAKGESYDADVLVGSLQPVLQAKQKGLVKDAFKLLARTAKSSPQAADAAALAATVALGNEAADVQKLAFDFIESYGEATNKELATQIAQYASVVSPSIRPLLNQWLASSDATAIASEETEPAVGGAEVLSAVEKLGKSSSQVIKLFALDQLAANLRAGRLEIPAVIFDGMDLPRLSAAQRLEPIRDLDELIDVCARVIEDGSLVDDAERAFDGLSRLCDQRPDDFEQRVGPLLKRVRQRLKKDLAPFIGIGPDDDVCGVVYAWMTGHAIQGVKGHSHGHDLFQFEIEEEKRCCYAANMEKGLGVLSRRSMALQERIAQGIASPLLSAPTHVGGWIAPAELVRRVNVLKTKPDLTDLCLAMLRLAPDGRMEALDDLQRSSVEWKQAVRYALGAKRISIGKTAALWIAAARARAPWCDDGNVLQAFSNSGPDGARAATYSYHFHTDQRGFTHLVLETSPLNPESVDIDTASVVLHSQRDKGKGLRFELGGPCGRTVGAVRWSATIWPQARESYFASGASTIADNLDWWEAHWENKALLEPLLDSGTPLRVMGLLLLSCGLAAKDPGECGLATDIAITAIDDGRLGTDNWGPILARLLPSGLIKAGRWQKTLAETARVSPLHAAIVQQSLQQAFEGDSKSLPKDYSKLLDLLRELSIELNLGINHECCRTFLASLEGSGKAARLAKELLAFESHPDAVAKLLASATTQRLAAASQFV